MKAKAFSRHSSLWLFPILLLKCIFINPAQSQPSSQELLSATFIQSPIKLDGRLSEPGWQQAAKISGFRQREPEIGEKATETTKVAVLYTATNLYIGAWCYDSNAANIRARELRRDFDNSGDDDFQVILDTYNDDRNGFRFITNPNAARSDAQVFNNGESVNKNWDGVWDVASTQTSEGWFVEIRIPFSTLKFRTNIDKQIWGVNFERNIRRKREKVLWQGWSRDASLEQMSRSGHLTGLDRATARNFVEIKPYAISGGQFETGDDDVIRNAGGDINYLITPTLSAKLTLNTDFAQVEADRQQINLTRFPLFFPEKREFFLEGQNFFDMGFGGNRVIPFHSRRIGLDENNEKVSIIAGTRLLGKVNNATLGAMSIQTAQEDTLPSTHYSVASWRQDLLKQSSVGLMSVNKIRNGRWHTTTGMNFRYSTSELFGNKFLNMGGALIQTYNSDEKLRSQANAFRVFLNYPNDFLNVFTSAQRSPAEFEPEVALMRRRNFQELFGLVQLQPRPKNFLTWIRQFTFMPGMVTYTFFDDTKELQTFNYQITPLSFNTQAGESFSFSIERSAEGVKQDFTLAEDVIVQPGEYWMTRFIGDFSTFGSRIISGSLHVEGGDFFNGEDLSGSINMQWRTSKFLNINLDYERNWVDLPQGDFQTDLVSTRFEYAVTPDLFGSIFAQWNNQRQRFNLNYRLEWIPKPGANVFLIFNQLMDTSGDEWQSTRTGIMGKVIWRFVI